MSNATLPLVRLTGGLADTVIPVPGLHPTGFGFAGATRRDVLQNLIDCVRAAASLYEESPERFIEVQRNAFVKRFSWKDSARAYIDAVYSVLN